MRRLGLYLFGRMKDVFRVGGENVAPAEVEEVLLAHPAVETAQVVKEFGLWTVVRS